MADDDEEVLIRDCPLHRYLVSENFSQCNQDVNIEMDVVSPVPDSTRSKSFEEIIDFQKKITISDNRAILAHIVLTSGFMFPEHISDLGNIIDLENIQVTSLLNWREKLFFSTLIVAGVGSVFFSKQNFTILKIILSILSGFSVSKLFKVKYKFSETKTLRNLITTLQRLWYLSRKTMTFISESELSLRSRLFKKNLILSDIDLLELKSTDHRLLLPELRKQYYSILKEISVSFSKTFNYVRTAVVLIPVVNESCYLDLNSDDFKKVKVMPTMEELKKAYNILLLLQSEFLKRLFLSYVTELWDKDNSFALEGVMKCLIELTQAIQGEMMSLELLLKECFNFNQSNTVISSKNFILRTKPNDESLISFSRKFLIKSEVNLFSALQDVRIIGEMLSDYVQKNNSDVERSRQFQNDLVEKMSDVKKNLDSFMRCYTDNLSILQSATRFEPHHLKIERKIDSNTDENVKKTGIEVGRSCFDPNNEDEVFISLSGPVALEPSFENENDDFEHVPEPLPMSVLLELKCALKEKREEWIEREKKALGSSPVNLDLDELISQQEQIIDSLISKSKCNTKQENDIASCNSARDDSFIIQYSSEAQCSEIDHESNGGITFPQMRQTISNIHQSDSFVNKIKSAQEKFNLKCDEEVFDD